MLFLKFQRTTETAKAPTKAHESDMCWDLYADEDVELLNNETKVIQTGLRFELPLGYGLKIEERSGLACKGILIGAGIIDQDYRGPLGIVVRKLGRVDVILGTPGLVHEIKVGDKIAQCRLIKMTDAELVEVDNVSTDTSRSEKGFGSSG